jgi:hypothetical protein
MKRRFVRFFILLTAVVSGSVLAASPGSLIRNETIRSQPSSSAASLGSVAKGTAVEITGRQGGWVQVQSGRTRGWVRLLSVRAGSGGAAGAGLGDVVGIATNKSDPSRVVAVAGVRGLSEEDLKKAAFNPTELAKLESLGVTTAQANAFAAKSGLKTVSVAELPKPQNENSNGGMN